MLVEDDLHGATPAFVMTTDGFDPLCCEGELYAQRLSEAGNEVEHLHLSGANHGVLNAVPGYRATEQVWDGMLGWRTAKCDIHTAYQAEVAVRALVDMNDTQIEALDALAKQMGRSRAALIRAAIDDYLDRHHREQVEDGFGLWGERKVDGLAYQEKLRREW